jgi:hypothetical protein
MVQSSYLIKMMELKWSKNKASGILTAKTGYQASIEEEVRDEKLWWCKVIWKSDSPLKIRILLWLALANGIPTWDNGQKRSWQGPH